MAVQGKTINGLGVVDLTPQHGMDLRSLAKNKGAPYVQNTIHRNNIFDVRAGFGLLRQYDTTLNCGRTFNVATGQQFGIGACIGAIILQTAWGTSQILEVRPLLAFTGDLRTSINDPANPVDVFNRRAATIAGLCAIVHDLATGRTVEFVLHDQDAQSDDLSTVYPNYATRFGGDFDPTGVDHSRWIVPPVTPKWALFAPISTGIAFGTTAFNVVVTIDGVGLFTYRPIDIARPVDRKNNSFDRPMFTTYAGEQGALSPLNLSGGLLSEADGFVYLNTTDIGLVTCASTWHNDRVIYASGNSLWFSDPFSPQAVQFDSRYVLPTSSMVTLVAGWRNFVFIATGGNNGQCWVYQPTLTSATSGANTVGTVAQGSLTLISGTNGCVGQRAWCVGNDGVYFVDNNGVYLYAGGVGLVWLSKPIDALWSDPRGMQLPLTDFYQASGITGLDSVQLPARMNIGQQMQGARLTWDDNSKTLLCVCDEITLCWTADFGWSCWLFQTHAGNPSVVQGAAGIAQPTIVADDSGVYLLGGPELETYKARELDNTTLPPVTVVRTAVDNGAYLLQYGRGGALDRSTCMQPAKAEVWFCEMSGYIVAGNVARIATSANHDYTILEGDDVATTCRKFCAAVGATDATYNFIPQLTGILCARKFRGPPAQAVTASFLSGTGSFVASQLQASAVPVLTDADLEDQRAPIGGYVEIIKTGEAVKPAAFLIGQPTIMPVGFKPSNTAGTLLAAETVETIWYPVMLANCTTSDVATPPEFFALEFDIDPTRWEPIVVPGGTNRLAAQFPVERLQSVGAVGPTGYGTAATMDANHQLKYTPPAAPGNSGTISASWTGTGGAWSTAPYMNLGPIGPSTLFWLGFRFLGTPGQNAATAFWPLAFVSGAFASVGVADDPDPAHAKAASIYFWQSGKYLVENEHLATKVQAVDWVVKTPELEVGGFQFRVCGDFLTVMHLGSGADKVCPGWIYGALNTLTSTDMRDYSAQAIDFALPVPGNTEQRSISPFPRLQAAANAALVLKTFRKLTDTTGPKWGSVSDSSKGNLLIDDAAVDTLAAQDGSQGMRASVMVHGTMNSDGDGLRLARIETQIAQIGQRRRMVT